MRETRMQALLYCLTNKKFNRDKTLAKIPRINSIVRLDTDNFIIGMEKLDCNLNEYLERMEINNVPEDTRITNIRIIINKISKLLMHLQKDGFMHRDLHCKNVMIQQTNTDLNVYIIDFGLSVIWSNSNKPFYLGNMYTAPFVFNETHDLRMLLRSLAGEDLLPKSIKTAIAIRFYNATNTYLANAIGTQNTPIFHFLYNSVSRKLDLNFTPTENFDIFNYSYNIPTQKQAEQIYNGRLQLVSYNVPSNQDIQSLPPIVDNKLRMFVKNNGIVPVIQQIQPADVVINIPVGPDQQGVSSMPRLEPIDQYNQYFIA
jgi:serine/threonine protein kinase